MELGAYSLSYRFKNYENDFILIFLGIYGPPLDMERREMWEEFDTSRGLQKDP